MNLTAYALKEGGTGTAACPILARIAAAAECSAATLYMISKGHKQASPKLARRIEQGCGGEVSCRDLRPDVFGQPEAPAVDDEKAAA